MADTDWGGLIAAFGPTGALVVAVIYALAKSDFIRRDDPSRNDVLNEIKAMRRDSEAEFRTLRDRMTKVETILDERRK